MKGTAQDVLLGLCVSLENSAGATKKRYNCVGPTSRRECASPRVEANVAKRTRRRTRGVSVSFVAVVWA